MPVVQDLDPNATDLMKCINALREHERTRPDPSSQLSLILLGGLSGRIDQTIHTMAFLHKLRKSRERTFVVTNDNVAWVLDSVRKCLSFTLRRTTLPITCARGSTIFILICPWLDPLVVSFPWACHPRSFRPEGLFGTFVSSFTFHLFAQPDRYTPYTMSRRC